MTQQNNDNMCMLHTEFLLVSVTLLHLVSVGEKQRSEGEYTTCWQENIPSSILQDLKFHQWLSYSFFQMLTDLMMLENTLRSVWKVDWDLTEKT